MESHDRRSSDIDERSTLEGSRSGRRRGVLLANLVVTASLLGWLLWRVDWLSLTSALARMRLDAASLALFSFGLIAVLEMMRLRVVLESFGLSWAELARMHVIGAFFGNFLPGQLGADVYKVVIMRPFDGGVARPLSLVLLLRAIGLIVLLAAALAGVLIYGPALVQRGAFLRPGFGLAVPAAIGATAIAVVLVLRYVLLSTALAEHATRFWSRARGALQMLTGRDLAGLIGLSILILVARAGVVYFLTVAVGAMLEFTDAVFVVALATLITLVPISFAGWGLREGAVTLLLVELAIAYEQAVLVALTGRAFILLLSGVGGLWLVFELVSGKRASRGSR